MEIKKLKVPVVTRYDSFEEMKVDSIAYSRKNLSDEEALEKALEIMDFFHSLQKAEPINQSNE